MHRLCAGLLICIAATGCKPGAKTQDSADVQRDSVAQQDAAISPAGMSSEEPKPLLAETPFGDARILFLQVDQDRTNGRLARELVRQTLLATAREEFDLVTRDASLGEISWTLRWSTISTGRSRPLRNPNGRGTGQSSASSCAGSGIAMRDCSFWSVRRPFCRPTRPRTHSSTNGHLRQSGFVSSAAIDPVMSLSDSDIVLVETYTRVSAQVQQ